MGGGIGRVARQDLEGRWLPRSPLYYTEYRAGKEKENPSTEQKSPW